AEALHRRRKTAIDVRSRPELPTDAQVEGEAPRDFEVIFNEGRPLFLDLVAQAVAAGRVIGPFAAGDICGAVYPVILRGRTDGPVQKIEQIRGRCAHSISTVDGGSVQTRQFRIRIEVSGGEEGIIRRSRGSVVTKRHRWVRLECAIAGRSRQPQLK